MHNLLAVHKLGFRYTRYADDLTFSGDAKFLSGLRNFIPLVHGVIRRERFSLHWKKTRVHRSNQHQRVTAAGDVREPAWGPYQK